MKTQHTPGPWTVQKGTNGFCETWQVAHTSEMRDVIVADCYCVTDEVYQGSTDNYVGKRTNEEHAANARLIAAAPDLLEALQHANKWMQALPTDDQLSRPAYGEKLTGREISRLITAAIAKATGA